jgi:sec-independent protein translocase protein TatC
MPEEELEIEKETEHEEEAEEDEKQSFTSHLGELRKRIFIILISIIVLFFAAFQYSEVLFKLLMIPLNSSITFLPKYPFIHLIPKTSGVTKLVFLAPTEAFWVYMKVSLIAGVIVSSPIIFFQVWKFVSPGLHKKEKKLALPFIFTTTGLFLTGALFCFLAVLPFAMKFLLNFQTTSLTPMISVEKYVDFCLKFILAFGVIFELPVAIVFLTRLGIVTPKMLSKNRKYAVLVAFVIGAVLTPPDAFTQTLMAVPMIFLYEAGILASRIFARKREPDDSREEHQSNGD